MNKTKIIQLRVTEDEWRAIRRQAIFVEQITVSQYIHNVLFPSKVKGDKEPKPETREPSDW